MNKSATVLIIAAVFLHGGWGGAAEPPQSNEVLKPASNGSGSGKTTSARGKATRIETTIPSS